MGARLVINNGERSTTNRPKGVGVRDRMLALSVVLVAWKVSLRSPCATADSQRTICMIIGALHLQIKKEKTKQNRKNNQHRRVRGCLLVFFTINASKVFFILNTEFGN